MLKNYVEKLQGVNYSFNSSKCTHTVVNTHPEQWAAWGAVVFFSFSNQIKSLLLSHHHSTSALVSEILESVLQTVQKKTNTIYIYIYIYLQTVQKTMCKIHIHITNTHSVL